MLLGIQFENPNNIDITDPVPDEFYSYFQDVAKQNTLIYEEVFATIPTDRTRTFAQVTAYNDMAKMKDMDPIKVTEIIYVHSKLMIIDDRMAICGSTNINDRSLVGNRDSELCVVINDLEEEDGRFNGQPICVGKFCSIENYFTFKGMLLGIQFKNPNNIDITDPVSDEFYSYFQDVAKQNTLIYEEVFATIPTDRTRTFAQVTAYNDMAKMKDMDPIKTQQKLKEIQGFVVEYSLYFLNEENYLPSMISPEGIAPLIIWT
ncbi:unnamed protein product [Rotaria sp. Silwood1]|nr:unnamed protein product [Rotaria sp. Silwood1]